MQFDDSLISDLTILPLMSSNLLVSIFYNHLPTFISEEASDVKFFLLLTGLSLIYGYLAKLDFHVTKVPLDLATW